MSLAKKKLYIGCTPNASVMNVWWHICHITSTTRYFSHSLTARALARDSHQIHCQWAYCYRYIVCCVACQWIVLTGNWFFGMEYKWANIYSNTHREKKNRWWCVKNVQIWLNGNCASNCMWCERHCEWMRQWSNAILKRNPWVFHVIFLRFQFLSISQSLRSNQKGQWLKRKLKSTSEGNEHAEKKRFVIGA